MNYIVEEDLSVIINAEIDWSLLKNKSVLITGATGMLGSYIVYTLLKLNETFSDYHVQIIIAVRNVEKAKLLFLDKKHAHFIRILQWDGVGSLELGENLDYIIHAASNADSRLYLQQPVETLLPNTVGTWRLLELGKEKKILGMLFFSSASAYGRVEGKSYIEETDSGYLNPADVRSCYGESKRMGENMCASYAHEYGLKACSVRISHTYGPSMNLESDSRVFAEFIKNIINGENIAMKSDGKACRAFCYVSDAIEAFFRILLYGQAGEIYNMCNSECFISITDLAELLVSLYPEKQLGVIRQERKEEDTYSENKNANLVVNSNEKLKSLGWKPKVNIKEGFSRTVNSFL